MSEFVVPTPLPQDMTTAPTSKPSRRPAHGRSSAEARIVRSIGEAIADRRLPPGTKLTEESLAEAFGVSRERVRKVLLLLAQRRVVTLVPNRGAFVAKPTPKEAREVFEARRVIERAIMERLQSFPLPLPPEMLDRLREHGALEDEAERAADRKAMIRLSGQFHLLLADFAGNATLAAILADLIDRSGLAIAAFERRSAHTCSAEDHRRLIAVLAGTAPGEAAALMTRHLDSVEAQLDLDPKADLPIDVRAVFAGEPA
ncbi:GntR family transcriptional regulator [Azospirillum picis]|uniref:DNA-binding GntR family transcriptional regulator n=1 Tax=Azospirillum picis TaxID=488438 RepID=A0ABU0MMQ1_9PROT|nr:GntR family transcriptional regulator [Azospirillum picis]MBP2300776.1 DNA-binding GntR family transcriptional regulator [Azospirillum picis]MDQ0534745.1 DNA-binding GntR family transcriptional regulator [Azospirillum picis]